MWALHPVEEVNTTGQLGWLWCEVPGECLDYRLKHGGPNGVRGIEVFRESMDLSDNGVQQVGLFHHGTGDLVPQQMEMQAVDPVFPVLGDGVFRKLAGSGNQLTGCGSVGHFPQVLGTIERGVR